MSNLLPILVALAVVLFVWGVIQIALALLDGDKRKLKQRLVQDGRPASTSPLTLCLATPQITATGLSGTLARLPLLNKTYHLLLQSYPDLSLARFLAISLAAAAVTFLVFAASGPLFFAALLAGCAGAAPLICLQAKRGSRQRQLGLQLPEALDFLSRIVRAGHSVGTGLQMMGEELPQPLGSEFRRAYSQHSLGQSMDAVLKDMAGRIQSTDFAFFVTAVLIQRQTGGDLAEVLSNISGMIRQRIRLQQHVKARTAEGRYSGYILVAFPAVMFLILYVLSPRHARVMLEDSTGLMLLGIAFALQMLGLWAIHKITRITV